jgi:hypothetical protein
MVTEFLILIKNIIYSAASSTVNIDSTIDANDQVVSKIIVAAKDVEGFDVIDIYKNSSEKKIIDGIKTGEILVGGGANAALISTEPFVDPVVGATAAGVAPAAAVVAQNPAKAAEVAVAPVAPVAPAAANGSVASVAVAPAAAIDVAGVIAKNDVIKSNILIDIEYVLTPTKNDQQSSVPLDPTQIQEISTQYSRAVKVNNIELSNSLYKISLNGQVNYFSR